MPTVFHYRGFRFFFYANEGTPREPIHIHVEKDDIEAKFWLRPEVRVAYNDGYEAASFASCWRPLRPIGTGLRGHGMSSLEARPSRVRFDADSMWVDLSDGRVVGVPLAWFPRLLHASPAQREQVRLSSRGLHWEALDEDVSVAGLLAGLGDRTKQHTTAA